MEKKDTIVRPDPTKFGASTNFDKMIWDKILNVIDESKIDKREIIENFILFCRRVNLAKMLAHIEVFKKTLGVPGSIVECGVFKGASLFTFCKLLEVLCPGDTLKRLIGFDT